MTGWRKYFEEGRKQRRRENNQCWLSRESNREEACINIPQAKGPLFKFSVAHFVPMVQRLTFSLSVSPWLMQVQGLYWSAELILIKICLPFHFEWLNKSKRAWHLVWVSASLSKKKCRSKHFITWQFSEQKENWKIELGGNGFPRTQAINYVPWTRSKVTMMLKCSCYLFLRSLLLK